MVSKCKSPNPYVSMYTYDYPLMTLIKWWICGYHLVRGIWNNCCVLYNIKESLLPITCVGSTYSQDQQ
jgi:hypothetical protein